MRAMHIFIEGPGADPGGGLGGRDPSPPPNLFGVPPNLIEREKTLSMCVRMGHVLVLNSNPDRSLSKILYPPLKGCIWDVEYFSKYIQGLICSFLFSRGFTRLFGGR